MKHNFADWRLIDTGPLDGPANMAVDEALLGCFDRERSLPVLRLYGWNPPALSLGRYQDAASSLDLPLCARDRVEVVRRMTGGGIIYHADEITYSIVCTHEQVGETLGVKEVFRRLCTFLLCAYRGMGLEPAFAVECNPEGRRLGERTAFCFAGKEECDIVVRGRKLGGNAQRRLRGLILQHGSIPLQSRIAVGARYLLHPAPGAQDAVSLSELGVATDLPRLKEILRGAFEEGLSARLQPAALTPAEAALADKLKREKYGCRSWNLEAETR